KGARANSKSQIAEPQNSTTFCPHPLALSPQRSALRALPLALTPLLFALCYYVNPKSRSGEIGIHTRLKIWRASSSFRFDSDLRHHCFAGSTFQEQFGNTQASVEVGGRETLAASPAQAYLGKASRSPVCRAFLRRVGGSSWSNSGDCASE